MVCIIDDREDVWKFAPNLITVKKYVYFQGTGDIHAPPGSREPPARKKGGRLRVRGSVRVSGSRRLRGRVSGKEGVTWVHFRVSLAVLPRTSLQLGGESGLRGSAVGLRAGGVRPVRPSFPISGITLPSPLVPTQ